MQPGTSCLSLDLFIRSSIHLYQANIILNILFYSHDLSMGNQASKPALSPKTTTRPAPRDVFTEKPLPAPPPAYYDNHESAEDLASVTASFLDRWSSNFESVSPKPLSELRSESNTPTVTLGTLQRRPNPLPSLSISFDRR